MKLRSITYTHKQSGVYKMIAIMMIKYKLEADVYIIIMFAIIKINGQ